jgi:hypothetical protein
VSTSTAVRSASSSWGRRQRQLSKVDGVLERANQVAKKELQASDAEIDKDVAEAVHDTAS